MDDEKQKSPVSKNSLKRTKRYREIRNDLKKEAEVVGKFGAHVDDMIDQYMELWVTSQLLQADIDARGVSVSWSNSSTQYGVKKNDSVSEKLKVVNQMIMIRRELGLGDIQSSDGDEDDEL